MTDPVAAAALGGLMAALGVLLLVATARGHLDPTRPARQRSPALSWPTLVATVAAGALGYALTGWPVAAVIGPAFALGVPRMRAGQRRDEQAVVRLQALSDWSLRLSGVLTAGTSLEQTLVASQRTVPAPLVEPVTALVAKLRARVPTERALRELADWLDDPVGDLAVGSLLLAAQRRGKGLAAALSALSASMAAEVAMRREIEAERAKPRSAAAFVTVFLVVAVVGLALFARSYVAPLASPGGQVVVVIAALMCGSMLVVMHRLARGGRRGCCGQPRQRPGRRSRVTGVAALAGMLVTG
ncbi:MAG TPA: type II secretion system F family protein, partial [Frankiaceae bacterium]|nr:type II secretion system F family protein [Frankiaceae bacterium]